jgi:predicted transcriptional regulator of viral defense system
MESYPKAQLVNLLHQSPLPLFTLTSLKAIFGTNSRATLNALVKSLVDQKILEKIAPGLYNLSAKPPDQFTIANFLVEPSYISFESALSYHGVLSQFPFIITSATTNKAQIKTFRHTYQYYHLQPNLYFGYTYINNYLLATPEKALLDQLYLATKKYRLVNWDEYDLEIIRPEIIKEYAANYQPIKGYKTIIKQLKENGLC